MLPSALSLTRRAKRLQFSAAFHNNLLPDGSPIINLTATVKSSIVSAIDSALHTSLRSRSCRKRRAPQNPFGVGGCFLQAGNNALDDDSRIQTTATTAKATRVVSRPQSSDLLFWMRCMVRNNSCRRLILSHRDSLLPLVAHGTFTDPEGVRKHLLRLPSLFRRLLS